MRLCPALSEKSILSAGDDWGRIVLLDNPFWPEYARRDLASIAAERGQAPLDTVYVPVGMASPPEILALRTTG